ncbi:Mannose-6-phosphate isomerase, partial [Dimargaris verticillata]
AIFLGANEPHAYLSGDIIECMATSDNVVRAGLTPKFKDVEVLIEMLTYDYGEAQNRILNGTNWDQFTTVTQLEEGQCTRDSKDQASAVDAPNARQGLDIRVYDPPIPEFVVARMVLTTPQIPHVLKPVAGPSVLLIIQGHGQLTVPDDNHTVPLQPGHVFFIAADTALTIQQDAQSPDELMCYRAFCIIE